MWNDEGAGGGGGGGGGRVRCSSEQRGVYLSCFEDEAEKNLIFTGSLSEA